jgi:flagellar motor switch protein FliN/FliY
MVEMAQAVEEKTEEQQEQQNQADQEGRKVLAQSVEFPEVAEAKTTGPGTSIDFLLDMDVPVSVAIGQTEVPIQRLLQLGPGSVLKLDKPIDAPADLYLKGTIFATGTIIVVEDRFAVKIKEILGTGDNAGANKK